MLILNLMSATHKKTLWNILQLITLIDNRKVTWIQYKNIRIMFPNIKLQIILVFYLLWYLISLIQNLCMHVTRPKSNIKWPRSLFLQSALWCTWVACTSGRTLLKLKNIYWFLATFSTIRTTPFSGGLAYLSQIVANNIMHILDYSGTAP